MFSFLQILTRTFQAVLSAFHIISSQQPSPHTSSLITSSGTKEHRRCCWSRRANIRWTVCPQLLVHLYLREAIKGFVSVQHRPHWPIYHSKNRTTQAWCLMEVTWKEIWIAYIFILHHFCEQAAATAGVIPKEIWKSQARTLVYLVFGWIVEIKVSVSQKKHTEQKQLNPGERKHMQHLTNSHTVPSFTPAEASHHFTW